MKFKNFDWFENYSFVNFLCAKKRDIMEPLLLKHGGYRQLKNFSTRTHDL